MPLSAERTITRPTPVFEGPCGEVGTVSAEPNLYGRDLSFNGVSSQHSTHALHPYVAAINPPLARALLETYLPKGGRLLDPFGGGGGVLVEATAIGIPHTSCDINPLAATITAAKTHYLHHNLIIETGDGTLSYARTARNGPPADLPDTISFWYSPEVISDLYALRKSVSRIADVHVRRLFNVILSGTARDVMLTYRGEVRLRRLTGKDLERFSPNVFESFRKRVLIAADRVGSLPKGSQSTALLADARHLPFPDENFTTIVCSPPYADDTNGVGYFQFSRNMLYWMGYTLKQIKEYRSSFLGEHSDDGAPLPSYTLDSALEHIAQRSVKHHRDARAFYLDYYRTLREMQRVATGYICIVIGDRVLSRTVIDNAAITTEMFEALGVRLKHYYVRELRKKRIANLGGDGGGTTLEHILIFRNQ